MELNDKIYVAGHKGLVGSADLDDWIRSVYERFLKIK